MMNLDPDYPRYFRNRMNRFLNEVATPARLLPILDQYAGIFENFPLDPDENSGITIREITDFVMSRPVYLKSQVGTLVP